MLRYHCRHRGTGEKGGRGVGKERKEEEEGRGEEGLGEIRGGEGGRGLRRKE